MNWRHILFATREDAFFWPSSAKKNVGQFHLEDLLYVLYKLRKHRILFSFTYRCASSCQSRIPLIWRVYWQGDWDGGSLKMLWKRKGYESSSDGYHKLSSLGCLYEISRYATLPSPRIMDIHYGRYSWLRCVKCAIMMALKHWSLDRIRAGMEI